VYTEAHPGTQLPPQRLAVMAFPATPPLAGFPAPRQPQPAATPSGVLSWAAAAAEGDWSLRFHLLAAKAPAAAAAEPQSPAGAGSGAGPAAASGAWDFWLAAVRVNAHGVPQQVRTASAGDAANLHF